MALGKFLEKAEQLKEKAEEKAGQLQDVAVEKIEKVLDELNDTIPAVDALGLHIRDVQVRLGVMPEIEANFAGTIESMEPAKIQEMMDANPGKSLLLAILTSLRSAAQLKDRLGNLGFKEVEVATVLVIPPKVSVRFTVPPPR